MDATFTDPNGTSVTLPLLSSGGGTVFGLDVGKPELAIRDGGGQLNPRFRDEYNGIQTYTLNGIFKSDNAYQNAIDIADMFKSQYNGGGIEFDFTLSEIYDTDTVVPAIGNDTAVTLTYDPGRKNWVEASLSLSRVDSVESNNELLASTPTGTGSGPVKLQGIKIRDDLSIERTIGRPNDSDQSVTNSNLPLYIYKRKPANDEFAITFQDTQTARQTVSDLKDLFSRPLGGTPLTLNFNGIYGMGAFNVVPTGSQAIRFIEVAGEEGISQVPQINLKRVR
jgi:hypothetical protein